MCSTLLLHKMPNGIINNSKTDDKIEKGELTTREILTAKKQ